KLLRYIQNDNVSYIIVIILNLKDHQLISVSFWHYYMKISLSKNVMRNSDINLIMTHVNASLRFHEFLKEIAKLVKNKILLCVILVKQVFSFIKLISRVQLNVHQDLQNNKKHKNFLLVVFNKLILIHGLYVILLKDINQIHIINVPFVSKIAYHVILILMMQPSVQFARELNQRIMMVVVLMYAIKVLFILLIVKNTKNVLKNVYVTIKQILVNNKKLIC
ncbi:hypothetical protein IMG5_026290, partial [Ichthyophthirius multifiliis]